MERPFTFGIIGGYGAAGRAVLSELTRAPDGRVLIGGRDVAKASACAAATGNRASAARVDVVDSGSLDEFCEQCAIVINCAGPVRVLQDRVAQAARRSRCHYVDAAGMGVVKERLIPHDRELRDLGLSFVISAGWTPGLSELVPAFAWARASERMDGVESVTVYYGDHGDWSRHALNDGAWFLRKTGLRQPTYFHHGVPTRASRAMTFPTVALDAPLGSCRFGLFSMPELDPFGRQRPDCDVFSYSYLSGWRTAVASVVMAACPLPESIGVRMMRNVFRRNRLPVGGFIEATAIGQHAGQPHRLAARVTFDEGRDYWIHGAALATAARMIAADAGVRTGVHFVAEAIDPGAFLAALERAGVHTTERFEPVGP